MNNPIVSLNDLEYQVLKYLNSTPIYQMKLMEHILSARRSIIDKLLNAFIRESPIPADQIVFRSHLLILKTSSGTLFCPVKTGLGFGRFSLIDFPLLWEKDHHTLTIILSPEVLMDKCLKKHADYTCYDRVRKELMESTANLSLSQAMVDAARQQLFKGRSASNTCKFLASKACRQFAPVLSEQLYTNGHPLHPCAKIRSGFTLDDIFTYTPESASHVKIRWVFLHHSLLRMSTAKDEISPCQLMSHVFPGEWAAFKAHYQAVLKDYVAVPVHEWQYKNRLREVYKEEIEQGWMIIPEQIPDTSGRPTISIRTLIIDKTAGQIAGHLKLSLQVQLTGYQRTITPQTALNGPRVSDCLQHIQWQNPVFFEKYPAAFLRECCGGCFCHTDQDKQVNLSFLWRETATPYLSRAQHLIVSAFLVTVLPDRNQSVMQDYIQCYAQNLNIPVDAALPKWWHDYLQCVLPPVLLMLSHYGIGMEAHSQNVLVAFENGAPVKAIFRDWGGLRIFMPRLEEQGLHLEMEPGSVTVVAGIESSRNKLIHAVLQVHIGEMIKVLCNETQVPPSSLWKTVYDVIYSAYQYIGTLNPRLIPAIISDFVALTSATVSCKSMVAMQLMGSRKEIYFKCSNPLHEFTAGRPAEALFE